MNTCFVKAIDDFYRHIWDIKIEGNFVGPFGSFIIFQMPTGGEIRFDEETGKTWFCGRRQEWEFLQNIYEKPMAGRKRVLEAALRGVALTG